jgi:hypothetical protein
MSDNDVLVELLGSPEIRTIRKPENILGRGNGDSDDASGYDLTNPNLHHGAEEIYRPVQSSEPLGAIPSIGAGATVSDTFQLQVVDSGTTASVSIAESATAAATIRAPEPDAGSTLTHSIVGGADATRFTVKSSSGALSFVPAPDYEKPTEAGGNSVYDVTVQVSDGTLTDTQAIAVTVNNVNDNAPVITSNAAGTTASVNVAENGTAVATDHWGNVFFGMDFAGTVDMGAGNVTSAGGFDIGIVQYGSAGNYQWAHRYGDVGTQEVSSLATEAFEGYVYLTGYNAGTVDFGGGPLTGADMDAFIVKFGPDPTGVHTPLRNDSALWASPNPFNPLTIVHYSVAQPGPVRVEIYDARGARVSTLVNREHHAGSFTATWRGVDDAGQPVSSGVYFARLISGGTARVAKLTLVK